MLREKEDLISIGAYSPGSDPRLDAALAHRAEIEAFLRQPVSESSDPERSDSRLLELMASLERSVAERTPELVEVEEVTGEPALPEPGPSAIPLLGSTL